MGLRNFAAIILALLGVGSLAISAPSSRAESEVSRLQARAKKEKWTFRVGYTPTMEYPLEDVTGLLPPEEWPKDWDVGVRFVSPRETRLPAHFDWREEPSGLPPIKNQRNCGSCWAFGTVAVLESVIKIRDQRSVSLSEQQLVSCNRDGWSCGGGWFAHKYHVSPGAVTSEDFPYAAANVRCKTKMGTAAKIPSWAFVGNGGRGTPSSEQIKNAIMQYGPVAVTVSANRAMQAYRGGVFNRCSNGQLNHLVNLVGWDDAGGYWIMRNSWGTTWGEEGYMRIKYGCSRIGQTASFINYKAACAPQPIPYTGNSRTIMGGDTTFLGGMPVPGQTYSWTPIEGLDDPTSSRPLARPAKTTAYTLSVKNDCGTATQTLTVEVN